MRSRPFVAGSQCAADGSHPRPTHLSLERPLPISIRVVFALWGKLRGSARIVTEGLGGYWARRSRRFCPGNIGEVEEVQKIWLYGISRSQVSGTANEPAFDKFDYCRVIHRYMGNIVLAREWRDDDVR